MPDVFDTATERRAEDVFDAAGADVFDQAAPSADGPRGTAEKAYYSALAGAGQTAADIARTDIGPEKEGFARHEKAMLLQGQAEPEGINLITGKPKGSGVGSYERALGLLTAEHEARRANLLAVSEEIRSGAEAAKQLAELAPGNRTVSKVAEVAGGMVPFLASGPLAPVTGAAATAGAVERQALEFYRSQGMSEEEAYRRASMDGARAGVATGLIFAGLPGAGGRVAQRFVPGTLRPVAQTAVRTGIAAGEGGTVMGADSLVRSAMAMKSYEPSLTTAEAVKRALWSAGVGAAGAGVIHGTMEAGKTGVRAVVERAAQQAKAAEPRAVSEFGGEQEAIATEGAQNANQEQSTVGVAGSEPAGPVAQVAGRGAEEVRPAAGAGEAEGTTGEAAGVSQVLEGSEVRSPKPESSRPGTEGLSTILRGTIREALDARSPVADSWVQEFNAASDTPLALPEGYKLEGEKWTYTEPVKPETPAARMAREQREAMAGLTAVKRGSTAENAKSAETPGATDDLIPAKTMERVEAGTPGMPLGERPPDVLDWVEENFRGGVRLPSKADFGDYLGRATGRAKELLSLSKGARADEVIREMHGQGMWRRIETVDDLAEAMVRAGEARKGWREQARQVLATDETRIEHGRDLSKTPIEQWTDYELGAEARKGALRLSGKAAGKASPARPYTEIVAESARRGEAARKPEIPPPSGQGEGGNVAPGATGSEVLEVKDDFIENWFNDAIEATDPLRGARSLEGVTGAPVWLTQTAVNGALRAARLAYTTGRDLAVAIRAGIEYLRGLNLAGFREDQAQAWLESALGERATGQKVIASPAVSQEAKRAIQEYLYEKRNNATDEAAAKGLLKDFGLDQAIEIYRDGSAVPGAVRSKLLGAITQEFARLEHEARAKQDFAGAQALADRAGAFWNEALRNITDQAQSLQALRDIVALSPDAQVARVKRRLEDIANGQLEGRRAEIQQVQAAVDEGRKAGVEAVRQDPQVNQAARNAVDAAVGGSQETHRAVVMDLAEEWSQSSVIVAAAREAVRAKANELLNKGPMPPGLKPNEHLRVILDDLAKRAAGIAASYFQGQVIHAGGLAGLLKERLGLDGAHALRMARGLDAEFARQVKAAEAKLPKRIASARVARARATGTTLESTQSQTDAAIRRQLSAWNEKLGNVLRLASGEQEAKGQHVAERIVEQSGLTGEKADTLRNVLRNRWNALVTKAQVAKLEALQKTTGVKVAGKMKTAFERLVELDRLGALTSERFFDVVKKSLRLKELTTDEARQLRNLVAEAQKRPEGFLREREATDLLRFTEKLAGDQRWWDVPLGIFYANILSGLTTPAKIVFENTNLLVGNTLTELLAHPVRNVLHPVDYGRTLVQAYGRGLRKGALQAEGTLRTGTVTGVWEHGRTNVMEGKPFGARLEPFNFWKYFTRIIGTAHETTFKPAWEVKQSLIARELARREGLTGKARTQRIANLMANTDLAVAEARAQAVRELTEAGRLKEQQPGESKPTYWKRVAADKLDLTRRVTEILEQRREENMPGTTARARDFALRTAYLNEPYGFLGWLAVNVRSALEKGRHKFPVAGTLAKTQIPFTTIVANLCNEKLNWSPAGLVRAAMSHKTGELYGRPLLDPGERSEAYAKAIMGTVVLGAAAAWFGDHIHGNGPSSPQKRKQLQAAGWIPHSIEWNGKYHTYMHTPAGIGLAIIGNWLDWHRYGKGEDTEGAGRAAFAAKATLNAIVSQGMLDSLRRLFEALGSESTSEGGERLQKVLTRVGTSFAVPNLVQQVDRLWDDTVYDQTGIGALLTSQVPFVRRENKPVLNVLGEPVKSGPFHYWASEQSKDAVWRMLADRKIFVPEPSKNTIIGSKSRGEEYWRAITPDEYYDLVAESGPKIKERLEQLLPTLESMEPEGAQAMVNAVAETFHKQAKARIER